MQIELNNVVFEALAGDITQQADCAAIVSAANAQLTTGGGVAGAIHQAAGPGEALAAHQAQLQQLQG